MLIELIVGKLPGAKEPCLHSLRGITQHILQDCPQVKGVAVSQKLQGDAYARGEKTLFTMGETTLEESLRRPAALFPDSSIALRYGASSFFQVNTLAAEQRYGAGAAMLAAKPVQDLWDLYCGVGSIGLFMAPLASSLYGVECVGAAIQQARENAKGAGLARCRFEAGDASLAFRRMREAQAGEASTVIVDPPRAGLSPAVINGLLEIKPGRILYISCNMATLARDAARLAPAFTLQEAQPVDLFPQTPHVEAAVLLCRNA